MKIEHATHYRINHAGRISYAGPKDCVAGRGGYTNTHKGTIAYRAFVDERYLDYRWWAATNQQKQEIRDERIQAWRAQGGRFLRGDQINGFVRMTEEEEQRKTYQRLRENQTKPDEFFQRMFHGDEKDKDEMPEEPALYSKPSLCLMREPLGEF